MNTLYYLRRVLRKVGVPALLVMVLLSGAYSVRVHPYNKAS